MDVVSASGLALSRPGMTKCVSGAYSCLLPCKRKSFLGCRVLLANCSSRGHSQPARGRQRLVIESNELNKWGDTDGREGDTDDGVSEDDYVFANDTAKIVARVLTSRAVQRILIQLQETDLFVAHWLAEYCNSHPPMTGDKFVLGLLRERPIYAADKITGKQHFVSPPELANRIMVARKALAGGMSKFDFPMYISRTNTEVLRQHLESNSYTSGSYEKVERRRQRRA